MPRRGGRSGSRRPPVAFDADVQEFIDLSAHLKAFEPALFKAMGKQIRAEAKPAVKAVRAEVLKTPSKRKLHTAKQAKATKARGGRARLRQGIAKGIRVEYTGNANAHRVGVFIRATSSGLPEWQKGMQRAYNKASFRHPVFGNREEWVAQAGRPYFAKPIAEHAPAIRAGMEQAIRDAKRAAKLT